MAPKKKKGKELPPDPDYVSELQKQFYELEMNSINRKMEMEREYQSQLQEGITEIEEKIKLFLEEQDRILHGLEQERHKLQLEKIRKKEQIAWTIEETARRKIEYEKRIVKLEQEYNEMVERQTKELNELQEYQDTIEYFKDNREEILQKLQEELEAFEEREKEHIREMYRLEQKFREARNRMKRDMEDRLFQMSYKFQEDKVHTMPQSMIWLLRENIALQNEITNMTEDFNEMRNKVEPIQRKKDRWQALLRKRENDKIILLAKNKVQKMIVAKVQDYHNDVANELSTLSNVNIIIQNLKLQLQKLEFDLADEKDKIRELENTIEDKQRMGRNFDTEKILRYLVHRMKVVLWNGKRQIDKVFAIQLIQIGELEEDQYLDDYSQYESFKLRRQNVFDRRGKQIKILINELAETQLTQIESKSLYDGLDKPVLNFQEEEMIPGHGSRVSRPRISRILSDAGTERMSLTPGAGIRIGTLRGKSVTLVRYSDEHFGEGEEEYVEEMPKEEEKKKVKPPVIKKPSMRVSAPSVLEITVGSDSEGEEDTKLPNMVASTVP